MSNNEVMTPKEFVATYENSDKEIAVTMNVYKFAEAYAEYYHKAKQSQEVDWDKLKDNFIMDNSNNYKELDNHDPLWFLQKQMIFNWFRTHLTSASLSNGDGWRLGDKVLTDYYSNEVFEIVGIRKDELELKGDWSGGTHNVCQVSWYLIHKCKKVLPTPPQH
jgi:hypothetical protein